MNRSATNRSTKDFALGIWRAVKRNWRSLIATDLAFKAIALILLTPIISLCLRVTLDLTGHKILADTDILYFLLRPVGLLTMFAVVTLLVAIIALEQVSLMAILARDSRQESTSAFTGIWVATKNAWPVCRLAGRVLLIASFFVVPVLAVGALAFWLLLTEHDINYYLRMRPPQFYVALLVGALLAFGLAIAILRLASGWVMALQLVLLENMAPSEALRISSLRATGKRRKIAKWLFLWFILTTSASMVLTGAVHVLARSIVPRLSENLALLLVAMAFVVTLFVVIQLLSSLFSAITFSAALLEIYRDSVGDRFDRLSGPLSESVRTVRRRRRDYSAMWLAAGVVASLTLGYITLRSVRLEDSVEVTAHRGASGSAPENTLASVRKAIRDGADWAEIDVQESSDGEVVVIHDSDFMRQSGNPLKIWEATLSQMRDIDIGSRYSPEFQNERVPTLREVLEECKGRIRVNIELKYYGHDVDLERKVIDIVESIGMPDEIVVMSLKSDGIKKLKSLRPHWTCGLLTAVKVGELWRAEADFLAVKADLATRSFVRSAHRHGKRVHVWTVNDPATISNMISRGVDNVITDHPATAKSVLRQRANMSVPERLLLTIAEHFGVRHKIFEQ